QQATPKRMTAAVATTTAVAFSPALAADTGGGPSADVPALPQRSAVVGRAEAEASAPCSDISARCRSTGRGRSTTARREPTLIPAVRWLGPPRALSIYHGAGPRYLMGYVHVSRFQSRQLGRACRHPCRESHRVLRHRAVSRRRGHPVADRGQRD